MLAHRRLIFPYALTLLLYFLHLFSVVRNCKFLLLDIYSGDGIFELQLRRHGKTLSEYVQSLVASDQTNEMVSALLRLFPPIRQISQRPFMMLSAPLETEGYSPHLAVARSTTLRL